MRALANFKENYGAFADDLVNYQSWHDYQEYRAKGKDEVELPSENVLVGMLDKETGDLTQVLLGHFFIFQKLRFWHSKKE